MRCVALRCHAVAAKATQHVARCLTSTHRIRCERTFNPFQLSVRQIATPIQVVDAGLANRPFLVFDFWALWRSGLSARVPESQKLKVIG